MRKRRQEDHIMCQTSEAGERVFSGDELVSIRADISNRIIEIFGFQKLSAIGYRLKLTPRELRPVLNGEKPPSIEILLTIQKVTGASIDWLLTGKGPKFLQGNLVFPTPQNIFPAKRLSLVQPAAMLNHG